MTTMWLRPCKKVTRVHRFRENFGCSLPFHRHKERKVNVGQKQKSDYWCKIAQCHIKQEICLGFTWNFGGAHKCTADLKLISSLIRTYKETNCTAARRMLDVCLRDCTCTSAVTQIPINYRTMLFTRHFISLCDKTNAVGLCLLVDLATPKKTATLCPLASLS